MIVVADSGPLHYLILLEQTELLHSLYDEVVIPEAVSGEFARRRIAYNRQRLVVTPPFLAPGGRGHP
jgi:hypothetical protein